MDSENLCSMANLFTKLHSNGTKTFYSIQYVLFCKSWQQLLTVIIGTGRENKSERTIIIIIITVLHAKGPQVYTYM